MWLIGAGPMALDYAKVLASMQVEFLCITRSEKSADNFSQHFQQRVISGGLDEYIKAFQPADKPEHAIVATNIECLADNVTSLIQLGVKSILVEKPAGIEQEKISLLEQLSRDHNVSLYLGYNRRFYESVTLAKQLIEQDGGARCINYEITEWSHEIDKETYGDGVKENWFLANTSHVVDLAFALTGKPNQLSCYTSGNTSWHSRSAIFSGAGVTENGVLFNYHGNWNAPGRWSLEILTDKRRFIFRPLEQLHVQQIGSVAIERIDFEYQYDDKFKPGLYQQTKAFLEGDEVELCSIFEHIENVKFYCQMANYSR